MTRTSTKLQQVVDDHFLKKKNNLLNVHYFVFIFEMEALI